MIVVSDTTPLHYLAVLGELDLLPRLFGEVHCPDAVIRECRHPHAPAILRQWASPPPEWLRIAADVEIESSLLEDLDVGEAAAITLAQRLGAEVVLIDDRVARQCALKHGFVTAGTLNILAQAGARSWLDYNAVLVRLRAETNFWFTQKDADGAWASVRSEDA